MKRIAAICLSLVYLAMVSGVVVNTHYCMGKVASVAIGHSENDRCGDCGMANTGCCKDEVKVFKVSDTHAASSVLIQVEKPEPRQAAILFHPGLPFSGIVAGQSPIDKGPPLVADGRDHCILYHVFRI
ncbi:MAG: hypothetical protein EBZ67_00975 [Chitinophagia bacterium]|nr:hypothetical protein [Chitinophagia bacterium]